MTDNKKYVTDNNKKYVTDNKNCKNNKKNVYLRKHTQREKNNMQKRIKIVVLITFWRAQEVFSGAK